MFKKKPPEENEFQTRVRAYMQQRAADNRAERVYSSAVAPVPGTGGRRLRALVMILAALFLLKTTMIFFAGPNVYVQKLQPYLDGTSTTDRVIAFVLQPDPATSLAADLFQQISVKARSLMGIYTPKI